MVISHQHKFIFIHVDKTGGLSVTKALEPYCDARAEEKIRRHNLSRHAGLKELGAVFGRSMVRSYFTFAFERNPWDKCLSLYYYQLQNWNNFRKPWRHKNPTFQQWFYPLGVWPKKLPSRFTKYASGGRVAVDFLGKYETLADDFRFVCEQIGIPEAELPLKNKSLLRKTTTYREHYTPRMRRRVERVFRREISALGYEF